MVDSQLGPSHIQRALVGLFVNCSITPIVALGSTSQLTNEELNSLMDKWENETLLQIADQAEERGQTEELNSVMDKWEKEEKEALVQIADQADERVQLEPTQEQKVTNLSISCTNYHARIQ